MPFNRHLMMTCGNKALEKIYEYDKESGAFIISTAIERYPDVFNEWDSAPWRRKDIDYDLRVFLEESSADIPLKNDIILQFNVSLDRRDTEKEERIKAGLKTYFTFVRNATQRQIRRSYQASALYVFAAFVLLFISFTLRPVVTDNIILSTLVEGVIIGAWVFLWEAISTYAFTSREWREKFRHYKRFSNAPIRFNYLESPT
jgi:hypothetical protein